MPDAETILDAADLARDAGFINPSDRPLIAVIFFALLCLACGWAFGWVLLLAMVRKENIL